MEELPRQEFRIDTACTSMVNERCNPRCNTCLGWMQGDRPPLIMKSLYRSKHALHAQRICVLHTASMEQLQALTAPRLFRLIQGKVGNRWSEVAKHIPGRTGQQCAQRWRHKVSPVLVKSAAASVITSRVPAMDKHR